MRGTCNSVATKTRIFAKCHRRPTACRTDGPLSPQSGHAIDHGVSAPTRAAHGNGGVSNGQSQPPGSTNPLNSLHSQQMHNARCCRTVVLADPRPNGLSQNWTTPTLRAGAAASAGPGRMACTLGLHRRDVKAHVLICRTRGRDDVDSRRGSGRVLVHRLRCTPKGGEHVGPGRRRQFPEVAYVAARQHHQAAHPREADHDHILVDVLLD